MGQQQLLLVVLSVIIVGISIVVGINMFGESALQANQDAVMQDVMTIATRAQEWYRKPAMMGGGGRSFSGMNLDTLNFPGSNPNGTYALSSINAGDFTVTGNGNEGSLTITVTVFPDSVGNPAISK